MRGLIVYDKDDPRHLARIISVCHGLPGGSVATIQWIDSGWKSIAVPVRNLMVAEAERVEKNEIDLVRDRIVSGAQECPNEGKRPSKQSAVILGGHLRGVPAGVQRRAPAGKPPLPQPGWSEIAPKRTRRAKQKFPQIRARAELSA